MLKIIPGQCKKMSSPVKPEDMELIKTLIPEMKEMCNGGKTAWAIAHCQVEHDKPLRFFVLYNGHCVINPHIKCNTFQMFKSSEGCMSYKFRGAKKIDRFADITVEYSDENYNTFTTQPKGLLAAIFQHELDHMNGISIYAK